MSFARAMAWAASNTASVFACLDETVVSGGLHVFWKVAKLGSF
jgi:hypothetical protein